MVLVIDRYLLYILKATFLPGMTPLPPGIDLTHSLFVRGYKLDGKEGFYAYPGVEASVLEEILLHTYLVYIRSI